MQNKNYDIIIIGAGAGGLNIASFCGNVGLKTLLIDKSEKAIGGDCLNFGCVPSKALIHAAAESNIARNLAYREGGEVLAVDIRKVTKQISNIVEHIRETENSDYLRTTKKIDIELGEAKFIDKRSISLNGNTYRAKKFVIATGSRPRELQVINDGSVKMYNNESIFSIDYLPQTFVFIGGGPINCELGQALARMGSKVTILHSGERILEKEDKQVSEKVAMALQKEGVRIICDVKLKEIKNGHVYYLTKGEDSKHLADAIFVGIGRELNIHNLDLEKAGIEVNAQKTRLVVDPYLRTTNKRVYVVGDVAGNYMFTHAAEMHAKVVINNLFSPLKKKFNDEYISWVTFTDPEISTFGRQEQYLKENGVEYEVLEKAFDHDDRALTDMRSEEFVKVFVNKKGLILGGVMVAKNAGELSREYVLAMTQKLPIGKLFDSVYPYPIASRINRSLAGQYIARRLTDNTRRLFRFLF